MGLGLHGGGVSVANWFLRQGANVRVTDLKNKTALHESIKKIQSKVIYTLGRHTKEDFLWAEIVVQNPGVPRESKYLSKAEKNGAQIINEATLFFSHIDRNRIIGVTGTRGKSTVAVLIHTLLKKKYRKAIIAGNIRSTLMLDILDNAQRHTDPVVLELSSWHLEILKKYKMSPSVAVITNVYHDHLDRYASLASYKRAKQNILFFQVHDDYAVLNYDNEITRQFGESVLGRRMWFSKKYFPEQNGCYIKNQYVYFRLNGKSQKLFCTEIIKIRGKHNRENILAAVCVSKIYHVNSGIIRSVIRSFRGLQDRMEPIRTVHGVEYINDTTSTTPQATIAALESLRQNTRKKKNVILIAGGVDKKIPLSEYRKLARFIISDCRSTILFPGSGSNKIYSTIRRKIKIIDSVELMSDVVGIAQSLAQKGDIVLLSPACASFNLHLHEFDRGEKYKQSVRSL